jgi:hypothetical protein
MPGWLVIMTSLRFPLARVMQVVRPWQTSCSFRHMNPEPDPLPAPEPLPEPTPDPPPTIPDPIPENPPPPLKVDRDV